MSSTKQLYLSSRREGYLWKRGKAAKSFQRRLFILDATENTLRYYVKEDVSFTFTFGLSNFLSLAVCGIFCLPQTANGSKVAPFIFHFFLG